MALKKTLLQVGKFAKDLPIKAIGLGEQYLTGSNQYSENLINLSDSPDYKKEFAQDTQKKFSSGGSVGIPRREKHLSLTQELILREVYGGKNGKNKEAGKVKRKKHKVKRCKKCC